MILGIDVGGTHTDAVLVQNLQLIKKVKVLTHPANIMASLLDVAKQLITGDNINNIDRIVLSTTISTNAIVQNKTNRVAMVLLSGPGLSPETLDLGKDAYFARGYVNHRGIPVKNINSRQIGEISSEISQNDIRYIGVVGKFSNRNPQQELDAAELLQDASRHISLGHTLSGQLNFPRRIATTYLNAAIHDIYQGFVQDVQKFVAKIGANIPVYILKADGGTILIEKSLECPVQTIHSGPAAGIMGVLATARMKEDAVALDIGGTTTDISIFADGVPLLEPSGVAINGRKTLIRGLCTKSIGVGGDSVVKIEKGEIIIGPQREGPAFALGGPFPTPTDAMIVEGIVSFGDKQKAEEAMTPIAKKLHMTIPDASRAIIEKMASLIADHVRQILMEVNNKPVYTIHELLEGKIIKPKILYVAGGPAAIAPFIAQNLGYPYSIPEHSEVSNALGVALARTTAELTILADTEKREIIICEEGHVQSIPHSFSLADAVEAGKTALREKAAGMGAKPEDIMIEVTESQEFNMVRDFYTTGKNIRVKVQIKPGLISAATER
ncbi:MAG TPA: hydantoinase [Syntrophaceae bacterium]|jgi:N-methylhydantoinase A/oxoprolinase/acetone carboxylase beta subunit|nr:hydantoinase [Syntrophaceae bacterium]